MVVPLFMAMVIIMTDKKNIPAQRVGCFKPELMAGAGFHWGLGWHKATDKVHMQVGWALPINTTY